jgi:hypothetical protein
LVFQWPCHRASPGRPGGLRLRRPQHRGYARSPGSATVAPRLGCWWQERGHDMRGVAGASWATVHRQGGPAPLHPAGRGRPCPRIRVNTIAVGSVVTSALDLMLTDDTPRCQMEQETLLGRIADRRTSRPRSSSWPRRSPATSSGRSSRSTAVWTGPILILRFRTPEAHNVV